MDSKLRTFVQSLEISAQQAQAVLQRLENDECIADYLENKRFDAFKLISAACQSLKLALGEEQVKTSPVDAALVEQSWFVRFCLTATPLQLTVVKN
jgi:hypothetical protein